MYQNYPDIEVPSHTLARHQQLLVGMIVRVPSLAELTRKDEQFRDYCIGRIEAIDTIADTVRVQVEQKSPGEAIITEQISSPRAHVTRCHLLPESRVAIIDREERGVVIASCSLTWCEGEFCDYYVLVNGRIEKHSENNLLVASHRGDVDPHTQLAAYEFQNPVFRGPRDALVESYTELRSATFGIEDLVGARVMLLAHQAEVVARVLGDAECRYILADEVGLGKTIEAAVILKGLRRRQPTLRTLIVAPASLTAQWFFELDDKFWLRFEGAPNPHLFKRAFTGSGLLVSVEELEADPALMRWVSDQAWDLLIMDEAHHIHKRPWLYNQLRAISEATERVLLLSATPIQRRAEEFLALLKLLNPKRYRSIDERRFGDMLGAQYELQKIVARIVHDLKPEYFEAEDFCDEMATVLQLLNNDPHLAHLIATVKSLATSDQSSDGGLEAALAAIAYIGENYRLERRVMRNRRVNLKIELPTRQVDESFAYAPAAVEREALDEIHEYVDSFLMAHDNSVPALEFGRLCLHSAFSTPEAVQELLQLRQQTVKSTLRKKYAKEELRALATAAAPREEMNRVRHLIEALPVRADEAKVLTRALWQVEQWKQAQSAQMEKIRYRLPIAPGSNRLTQTLRAIDLVVRDKPKAKVIIFATWQKSLIALKPYLGKQFGNEAIFEFHAGLPVEKLQLQADGFQNANGCAILLSDELGGEGRNFQMADLIVHFDLPWTPTKLEQRIGRVDRLGRTGVVTSVVPYTENHLEQDLYQIWQHAFSLFTTSMSGMEIALEGIQDELIASLKTGTRNGLATILPSMIMRANTLRRQVEEERYYEEKTIDQRRRQEFEKISTNYSDGNRLRRPILIWANYAGLEHTYRRDTDTVRYYPTQFSLAAMHNAKFADVPNMQEALARSRNPNNKWIEGSFNRSVALLREDLVFYAPGSDPWTDTVIRNALEADRGRCCAIHRRSAQMPKQWHGVELLYRVQVDPRPLLEAGYEPIHLLQAQGYLNTPLVRIIVSVGGKVVPQGHFLYQITSAPFNKSSDMHMGERGGSNLKRFKERYPAESWSATLERVLTAAQANLATTFSYIPAAADKAQENFAVHARGMRAATAWYAQHGLITDLPAQEAEIASYERISQALVSGLRNPQYVLESACFWMIVPDNE